MVDVTKSAFAALCGVSRARVAQWLAKGQIDGDAIVGTGHRARIRAEVAQAQLDERLDVTKRISANRRVHDPSAISAPTVESDIKFERLAQLRHLNQRAAEEAALRAGDYVRADDVRQQFGNIASRLMSTFEASFMPIANAIIESRAQTQHDVLRAIRSTWREVRAQAAKAQGEEALALLGGSDAAGER